MLPPASNKKRKNKAKKSTLSQDGGNKSHYENLIFWVVGLALGTSAGLLAAILLMPPSEACRAGALALLTGHPL